jgi:hypothetical protein
MRWVAGALFGVTGRSGSGSSVSTGTKASEPRWRSGSATVQTTPS